MLIDHGASLYFHHSWENWQKQALKPFAQVKDHVLLMQAKQLDEVDQAFRAILTNERITSIISLIPDEWLAGEPAFGSASEHRQAYASYLSTRIARSEIFINEAQHAREPLI